MASKTIQAVINGATYQWNLSEMSDGRILILTAVDSGNGWDYLPTTTREDRDSAVAFVRNFIQMSKDNGAEVDAPETLMSGNPGTIPLHESLAEIAQWTEYEAEVVRKAADEVDDDSLADSAHEQADAMDDAADALDDAAETAAETAAEVFVETGVPSDENPAEIVAGNPTESGKLIIGQDGMECRECGEIIPWDQLKTHYQTDHNAIIEGNPIVEETSKVVEDIVTDVVPDTVEESIAVSAGKDVAPEPDNWLFRKRFGK